MPKISIVTPCYNSAAFIGKTIQSVRAQTFQDWEHIVVDDGSHDESASIVQNSLAMDSRLRLVRQSNGGVCKARNCGFAACSDDSEYLCFLDADDCLEPDMLAVLRDYLERNRNVGLAYCDYLYMDSEDAALPTPYQARCIPAGLGLRKLPQTQAQTPFVSLFCGAPVLPSSSLLRRSVYEQTPGWDEEFGQHHEELDLFLNVALLSEIHYIPQPLLRYRQHAAQSTKSPGKFLVQQQKLDVKWDHKLGLTVEQQGVLERAKRFRDGRMVPYSGLLAGNRHFRRGETAQAIRFYGGAMKRYLRSFTRPVPRGNRPAAVAAPENSADA